MNICDIIFLTILCKWNDRQNKTVYYNMYMYDFMLMIYDRLIELMVSKTWITLWCMGEMYKNVLIKGFVKWNHQ